MSVPCNRCGRSLPKWELVRPDQAQCPDCGALSIVRVFPALFYAKIWTRDGGSCCPGRGNLLRSSRQACGRGLRSLRPVCVPALRGRCSGWRSMSVLLRCRRLPHRSRRVRKLAHLIRFDRPDNGTCASPVVADHRFHCAHRPVCGDPLLEAAAESGAAVAMAIRIGYFDRAR